MKVLGFEPRQLNLQSSALPIMLYLHLYVLGVEPSPQGPQPSVLPLHHTYMGRVGFAPTSRDSKSRMIVCYTTGL